MPLFRQLARRATCSSIDHWQSWVNDPFFHLVPLFHSTSKAPTRRSTRTPALDKILDENYHEANAEKRSSRPAKAASKDRLIDDAVWGMLWYDNWTRVMRSDLVGVERNAGLPSSASTRRRGRLGSVFRSPFAGRCPERRGQRPSPAAHDPSVSESTEENEDEGTRSPAMTSPPRRCCSDGIRPPVRFRLARLSSRRWWASRSSPHAHPFPGNPGR